MQPAGRGGRDDGGGGKRGKHSGEGSGDKDIDDITEGMRNLRTDDQKNRDIKRRLATQCIHVKWFACREGEAPTHVGGKHVLRRCERPMTTEHKPWCQHHYGLTNETQDDDPLYAREREKERKRLEKEKKKADEKAAKLEKKKKDDDDKGGGGGRKGGLGVPAWINSFLGMGEVEKK